MGPVPDARPEPCPADAVLDRGAQAHQVHGDRLAVAPVWVGGVLGGVGVDGTLRRAEPGVAAQGTLPVLKRAVKCPASWSSEHIRVDRACLFGYQRATAETPNLAHQVTVTGFRRQEPGSEAGNDLLLEYSRMNSRGPRPHNRGLGEHVDTWISDFEFRKFRG